VKIQLAERRRNNKDTKSFSDKVIEMAKLAMVPANVLGTIYQCGGRVKMREAKWKEAAEFFFDAVKNWDSCRRQQETFDCIKLQTIASLLSGSKINPFDDKTTQSYRDKLEIKRFEKVAKDVITKNADSYLVDIIPLQREEIVKDYIPLLTRLVQKELLLEIVKPYSNISMLFISKRIHATKDETENILVELILNQQIQGAIDEAKGILVLKRTNKFSGYYAGLFGVANAIDRVQKNVLSGIS